MKRVLIIGYGRFGRLLADLCRDDFLVSIVETDEQSARDCSSHGYHQETIDAAGEYDVVFIAVPISAFEATIRALADRVRDGQLIIDVCSVKVFPSKIMQQYVQRGHIIGTHPMFGPDSASSGLTGLQVALCPLRASQESVDFIRNFWESKGAVVLATTPDDHDRDTAYSQAFTYSIAKIINRSDLPDIRFITRSFTAITEVARLSARDTETLFHDMLFYNPYYSGMKTKLETSIRSVLATMDEIEQEQASTRT